MQEFPLIAACLLQGIGFEVRQGVTRVALPEPLGTVYRDTSIEWGMVVVDITQLNAVRYGIVGLALGQLLWDQAPSSEVNKGLWIRCAPGVPCRRPSTWPNSKITMRLCRHMMI